MNPLYFGHNSENYLDIKSDLLGRNIENVIMPWLSNILLATYNNLSILFYPDGINLEQRYLIANFILDCTKEIIYKVIK
jgi:hypothetical protein